MRLDKVDCEILRLLVEDPRNVSAIAREVGLPAETIRYRVRRLLANLSIRIFATPHYGRMGLSLLWAFLNAKFDGITERLLSSHPYVTYVGRCYGYVNGYLINILAPKGEEDKALNYLEELIKGGYIDTYLAVISYATEYILPDFTKYYNCEEGTWSYSWNPLITIRRGYYSLKEVKYKHVLLDPIDIKIVRELQVDATVSLTSLASKLGLSVASLRYHFVNHILKRGLIRYAIRFLPYPGLPLSLLVITSNKPDHVYSLYASLRGLPPIVGMALASDLKRLIVLLQVPLREKVGFYRALKALMDRKIIKSYFEVTLDPNYAKKYTIPSPDYYRAGRWVFISEAVEEKVVL